MCEKPEGCPNTPDMERVNENNRSNQFIRKIQKHHDAMTHDAHCNKLLRQRQCSPEVAEIACIKAAPEASLVHGGD